MKEKRAKSILVNRSSDVSNTCYEARGITPADYITLASTAEHRTTERNRTEQPHGENSTDCLSLSLSLSLCLSLFLPSSDTILSGTTIFHQIFYRSPLRFHYRCVYVRSIISRKIRNVARSIGRVQTSLPGSSHCQHCPFGYSYGRR